MHLKNPQLATEADWSRIGDTYSLAVPEQQVRLSIPDADSEGARPDGALAGAELP
jgi:hypothetical protein